MIRRRNMMMERNMITGSYITIERNEIKERMIIERIIITWKNI
jgi:hypothetical protein